MTTVTATRRPTIRTSYIRFCRRGKPRKVTLIVAKCKLLLVLNAVIQDLVTWQPNPVPAAIKA